MTANMTRRPARGPSIAELHGYFARAREAFDDARGEHSVKPEPQHGTCALFANRLLRAPAGRVEEILLKLEAADWLEIDPREALASIRADLLRLKAPKP